VTILQEPGGPGAPAATAPRSDLRRPAVRAVRLRPPRTSRLLTSDVVLVGGAVLGVTVALWVRHGGVAALAVGGTDALLSVGRITGLLAALAALAGVLLAARPRLLERRYGLDRLLGWHRWVGTATAALVVGHVVIDTLAWGLAQGTNPVTALVDLLRGESWMVAALAGTALILAVGFTSWRRIRRRMHYETWYFLHLTAYLAVLLAFGHQLTLGTDLVGDTVGLVWWIGLAVVVVFVVVADRVVPLVRAFGRAPLRIAAVTAEAAGTGAVHVVGPGLRGLKVSAGQFFLLRVMTTDLWWQPHPFSLSAAPTTGGLRFTVKQLGDGSAAILRARPGTRVVLEGPYGRFTAAAAGGRPVVLIGGGVGVAPLRAILEDCTPDQRPVVIVRLKHPADLPHRAELEHLVARRRGRLHVLAGPRSWFAGGDPFSAGVLSHEIPDVASRHAFVCGPASLERAAQRGLRDAGMPSAHIHVESFGV
jgi:predicted ferric reductase